MLKGMRDSRAAEHRTSAAVRLICLAAIWLGAGLPASAQTPPTAARPDRGFGSTDAYSISGIESIGLTGGNVNLSIPLAALPPIAGGKLSWVLRATYNSKLWDVRRHHDFDREPPVHDFMVDEPVLSPRGGWLVGGRYVITFRDSHDDREWELPAPDAQSDPDYNILLQHPDWHKRFLLTPDGAERELKPLGYAPFSGSRQYLWGFYSEPDPDTAGHPITYYTVDGTYIYVKLNPTNDPSGVRSQIYMPDGTTIYDKADGQRIQDTNGNTIRIWSDNTFTHYTDEQTGREVKVEHIASPRTDRVWFRTVGGAWVHADVVWGTTTVKGQTFLTSVVNERGGSCQQQVPMPETVVDVVREIVLPQTEPGQPGRRFTFSYNSDSTVPVNNLWWADCDHHNTVTTASKGMGSLNRMVMPSGAVVNYTYGLDTTHELNDANELARERILAKTVTHDGTTDNWIYGEGYVSNPDGSTRFEFAYPQDKAFGGMYGGADGLAGMVYKTETSGAVRVERRWARLLFTGVDESLTGLGKAVVNPVVTEEYTSLLGADGNPVRMSAKQFQYDYNGNLLQETDYDWFDPLLVVREQNLTQLPTGIPASAPVLRVINNSYYNQATSPSSANVYAKQPPNGSAMILNAPKETSVGASVTRFSYDSQPYEYPPTEGNVTGVSRFDDQGDTVAENDRWITTSRTYDPQYGNLLTSTDENDNVTHFYYEDATHALPTKVEADPLNGTGAQTTLTAYDHWTGLVTSATDANGETATIDYTNQLLGTADPFGRPGVVTGPAVTVDEVSQRAKVFTKYEDSLRRVTVESDLRAEGDRLLKARTTGDELGRSVLTEQSEDGSTYTVSTVTAYEQGGRVSFTSNPMRAAAADTDGWTRVTDDTAGRVQEVATFAGAARPTAGAECTAAAGCTGKVTTDYYAEFTTATDQAGRVRRSRTDALGRLVRVDEPSDINNTLGGYDSPTQPTAYTYDVLGNLTQVRQGGQLQLQNGQSQYVGGQTRSFTYGSLSRLSSARNPESGTIHYWFDENGNLVLKVDPRPRIGGATLTDCKTPYDGGQAATCYDYDGLNRVKSRRYNDGTPDVTFSYDKEYIDHNNLAHQVSNAKGQLTQVRSSMSVYNYTGYDALGRVTGSEQVMPNADGTYTTYSMPDYRYDLAGNLVSEQYPSGRVVKTDYDAAGRMAGVKNPASNFYYVGGDPSVAQNPNVISYTAAGSATQMRLGNGLWETANFNSRLQPVRIGLGTSTSDASVLTLDYAYGAPAGGTLDTTKNNGNLQSQRIRVSGTLDVTQTYDYDQLSRLTRAEEKAGALSTWQQVYSYDIYGNRTLANGTTTPGQLNGVTNPSVNPQNNRISSEGYVYDDAGNLICEPEHPCGPGPDNAPYYRYDADNMLVSAGGGAASGGASYMYDGEGRRVKRAVGATVTALVYNVAGQLVAEYSNQQPQPHTTSTSYLTHDHLGSVRLVTGQNKEVVVRNDYRPFGEEVVEGRSGYGGGNVRQKFSSKERDGETGLDYFGARYYSSAHGRFTTCDPGAAGAGHIVNPQRWNMYVFVIDNPLTLLDPDGQKDEGSNGSKQIDIFLTIPVSEEQAQEVRDYYKDKPNVRVYGPSESTVDRVMDSLNTAGRTVIILSHANGNFYPRADGGGDTFKGEAILLADGYIDDLGGFYNDKSRRPRRNFTIRAKNFWFFGCRLRDDVIAGITGRMAPTSSFMNSDGGADGSTQTLTNIGIVKATADTILNGGDPRQARGKADDIFKLPSDRADGDKMRLYFGKGGIIPPKLEPNRSPCMGCGPKPKSKPLKLQ
jgi:RHS repeat-associated protein